MTDVCVQDDRELRLVLLSACEDWADESVRSAARDPNLDWSQVAAYAVREQATGVLARRLSSLGIDACDFDPPAARILSRNRDVEEFRMRILEERCGQVLGVLRAKDIDAVLLKGAAIASSRFGSFRSRPMADIDLLVPEGRAAQAHALAREDGWVERGGGYEPDMYRGMQHLLPLVAADGLGFGLEIHTDVFPSWGPFDFSGDEVRKASVVLESGARIPSPEHLLLHACIHFAWSHGFRRGLWKTVRDVDVLLQDPGLDEAAFARVCAASRGATCVYWTLCLYRSLTGSRRADRIIEETGVRPPSMTRGILLEHLLAEARVDPEVPGTRRLRRLLWTMAVRPRGSGHGAARPWSESERWLGTDSARASSATRERSVAKRVRGLCAYLRRILGR